MVSERARNVKRLRPEPKTTLQEEFRNPADESEDRECVASLFKLRTLRVGIEFADERVPISFCGFREGGNERLDALAACLAKVLYAAEICGIGLDELRIQIVSADQEAELVSQSH